MDKKPREKTNPLWIKCRKCQTWNAKEVGEVFKYLDRYFKALEEKLLHLTGTKVGDEIALDESEPEGDPRP